MSGGASCIYDTPPLSFYKSDKPILGHCRKYPPYNKNNRLNN